MHVLNLFDLCSTLRNFSSFTHPIQLNKKVEYFYQFIAELKQTVKIPRGTVIRLNNSVSQKYDEEKGENKCNYPFLKTKS